MSDYYVHPTAEVSDEAKIGEGTKIWHHVHIREGAKIGKNCIIGQGAYIDHHVEIGDNVKIQNNVSVYYGVTIEDDVILAPSATLTNDLYPRSFSKDWKVAPSLIKRGASVGANATVVCGVTLGEYSMVAAGAVLTKSIPPYALVMGNPARVRGFVCKCGRSLGCVGNYSPDERMMILTCQHCGEIVKIYPALYELVCKVEPNEVQINRFSDE